MLWHQGKDGVSEGPRAARSVGCKRRGKCGCLIQKCLASSSGNQRTSNKSGPSAGRFAGRTGWSLNPAVLLLEMASWVGCIAPAHSSLICTLDPVRTCLCWKALLFVLVLLPDLCFHVPTQGENYPVEMISWVYSTHVYRAMNTRTLGLLSGAGGSTRRRGTASQDVSINCSEHIPQAAEKVEFTY